MDVFVLMILAHFVGDYLFQNQWMAIGKSYPKWRGHLACTVHVLAYTLAFVLVAGVFNPWALLSIAVPHWLIDRWSLAKYVLSVENEKLRKKLRAAVALKDWATHTPTCRIRRMGMLATSSADCDCGLNEALCIFEMMEKL